MQALFQHPFFFEKAAAGHQLTMDKPAMMATEVAPAVTMTPQVVSREPRAPRRRLLRLGLAGPLLGCCTGTGRPMEAAWFSRTICRGGLCLGGIILLRVDVTLAASSDLQHEHTVRFKSIGKVLAEYNVFQILQLAVEL